MRQKLDGDGLSLKGREIGSKKGRLEEKRPRATRKKVGSG